MKKFLVLSFGIVVVCLAASCGLIPKAVEFGQKSVPKPPEKTAKADEADKQAVSIINKDINKAIIASIRENASTNITDPLFDMSPLGTALALSLGPPLKEWNDSSTNLVTQINKNTANLDKAIDKFDAKIAPLVDHKVENTGFLKIPYFLYLGIVLGGGFLIYKAISIAVNVYSSMNPAFAVGANLVKGISSKVTSTAFGEVTNGIESLKDHLKTTDQTSFTSDEILKLINEHQERKQSPATQDLIQTITK